MISSNAASSFRDGTVPEPEYYLGDTHAAHALERHGRCVAALLEDPPLIKSGVNADGRIYADWFDKPSSWTGETLGADQTAQGHLHRRR